ncbi:GAF domain-containing SpoIIE family protein phosphatase [Kitasatospora sp. NPDC085879]|uniref:PP2C family protein-serine/threonine phosphatase n=1 Tax=Kitasatospora sp. NPDC085879 TaxID=3154769 RepID=UPI000BB0DF3C|nr:GAF domain-containing SpoIIE family protein phosphatase [Streptomyces sp. TLI_235]PBC70092.1 serine phosphatase RsbU (regulator of sigma subunit) [Streptomyces sp. TLI_235]
MDEYDVDEALQQALDRLTALAHISSALAGTLDARAGLERACRILAQRLGDWCAIDLLADDGRLERITASRRGTPPRDDGRSVTATRPPEAATGPLARVLRGAGPLLLTEADLRPVLRHDPWDAAEDRALAQQEAACAVIAPLRSRREVLGAVTVARTGNRPPLTDSDLPLVEDIAHRIALAIDNARLHRETEHIAERLQRSLLPAVPQPNHLTLAARYAPAHGTAEVGGDWYDAFVLPAGRTALIIGDVTGHDLHAAVTMSQLRNMLRGIACDRQEPPGRILHRLDLAQHALYPGTTASCVYAVVQGPEGGPWQLDHASAGHPPPLLVTRDGDTRFLEGSAGVLLGVDTALPRPSATDPLPPLSTVLLYTDGLIERRGENLDRGLARLRQHAAALSREAPDTLCDELLTGLAPDATDDIALLALRIPTAGAGRFARPHH